MLDGAIDVNCVFGKHHYRHLIEVLIPSLRTATGRDIRFNLINYAGPSPLDQFPTNISGVSINLYDHSLGYAVGFAEAHNILASKITSSAFVIVNPDCILHEGAIDRLLERYSSVDQPVGIVEGRQWPFEHPKEYDSLDLTTPWASGAFCLFNTFLYRKIGGMDKRFFLYLEDVDISWRMWLEGALVLYEPRSVVTHFTGGYFYRDDLVENEKFYSIRNFILLLRKFYGKAGEEKAIEMLRDFPDKEIVDLSIMDVKNNFSDFESLEGVDLNKASRIKVVGVNQFHELRS